MVTPPSRSSAPSARGAAATLGRLRAVAFMTTVFTVAGAAVLALALRGTVDGVTAWVAALVAAWLMYPVALFAAAWWWFRLRDRRRRRRRPRPPGRHSRCTRTGPTAARTRAP